jgi:hypothetical protein
MTYYFSRKVAGNRQQATSPVRESIMRNVLARILGLAVVAQCVFGCASLQPTGSLAPDDSLQSQQISSALVA